MAYKVSISPRCDSWHQLTWSVCTGGRTLRHNQIFSDGWFTKFSYPWCSASARLARARAPLKIYLNIHCPQLADLLVEASSGYKYVIYTVISRKVVGKMCTRQSRKAIWDMINTMFLTTTPVEPTFVTFLKHFQTHFHGLLYQFFQISLKNSELKTTHDAFRELTRAVFSTTFLEIAVYKAHKKD